MRKSLVYKEQKKINTDIENFKRLMMSNEKIHKINNILLCIIREGNEYYKDLLIKAMDSHEIDTIFTNVYEPMKKMISTVYKLRPKKDSLCQFTYFVICHREPYIEGELVTGGSVDYEFIVDNVVKVKSINNIFN